MIGDPSPLLKRERAAEKTQRLWDKIEVTYTPRRWRMLEDYRAVALAVLRDLDRFGVNAFIHGSLARGDVDAQSDIDIVVPDITMSRDIEIILTVSSYKIYSRQISQATPSHALKGHIFLDPARKISVTFPLLSFRRLEYEFYRFGGLLDLKGVVRGDRTAGCTKKLTLVEPTETGHLESGIVGREAEIARILGVSPEIVKERERVLARRDEIGRTGVFLKRELIGDESFQKYMKSLIDSNPAVRRAYLMRR
ncbi:MAG: nucleotidyltransferase domain-containing protein [Candidatus Bathyarchaeia archaeon]